MAELPVPPGRPWTGWGEGVRVGSPPDQTSLFPQPATSGFPPIQGLEATEPATQSLVGVLETAMKLASQEEGPEEEDDEKEVVVPRKVWGRDGGGQGLRPDFRVKCSKELPLGAATRPAPSWLSVHPASLVPVCLVGRGSSPGPVVVKGSLKPANQTHSVFQGELRWPASPAWWP